MTTECPICFDLIGVKNNITTECGHCFHASCLMTNISRNGFACPCCRNVMAEEEIDDSSDGTDVDDSSTLLDDEREVYSDDALRGLRLLTNLLEGEQHDQADVVAEYQYIEQELQPPAVPSLELITNKLVEQGITMSQLVSALLCDHEEYQDDEEMERVANDMWGKMRVIISNYAPENQENQETAPFVIEEAITPIPVTEVNEIEIRRNIMFDNIDDLRIDLNRLLVDHQSIMV